jgi:hypothetical protein
MKKLAQQQATWIKGPSLPSHNPDATARHYIRNKSRKRELPDPMTL